MLINKDSLGERGEAIFRLLITEFDGASRPMFRPYFLGDKWPAVDFIVELIGVSTAVPYFFVQVKATRSGYTQRRSRLKVKVDAGDVAALAAHPAPTYIVGIDEEAKVGFLVSAKGRSTNLSSVSTQFPINAANRRLLWEEVKDYWNVFTVPTHVSRFLDPEWR
ncbi:MAG: DUF4365 domain-containing protein [Armatimonadota bacterium]|nr:DUF4365 domain-containing protein [Armatimonadota bacterium]